MTFLFVVDAPEGLNPATDTTLLLMAEALRRGHGAAAVTLDGLSLRGCEPYADARPATGRHPDLRFGTPARRALRDFSAVVVRKDPPFDAEYLLATLILERARDLTPVVNDPRALRGCNEKLFALEFGDLVPQTRVLRSPLDLRQALADFGGEMIVKPLDGCGGRGVFHVRAGDPNTRSILEAATSAGTRAVVAQRYLKAARTEGDKRIFLLDGDILGAVLRVAAAGEARCNRCSGGEMVATALTPRERAAAIAVGTRCRREGLHLVGIDMIGGHLTEINVTSPTGLVELGRLEGRRPEADVLDWLERRAAPATATHVSQRLAA